MSSLETNLKNSRPRPHHLETETETISKRLRPEGDRNRKKSVSRPRPVSRPSSLPYIEQNFSDSDSSFLKFYDLNFDSRTSENYSDFIPKCGTPAIWISQP